MLKTETPGSEHPELDLYPTDQLVAVLIADQLDAVKAVQAVAPQISAAVAAALPRMLQGGRLIYVGAGTSGRLGVLDGVELSPTFSWPRERAIGLIAGGQQAMFGAIEGAEDSAELGAADLAALQPQAQDVVLLLAASGSTPYVMGVTAAARSCGALTISFANNPGAPLTAHAEMGITLDTGNEIISGSTRLKAGTAQKIALNTFSSALMVRLNKVYGNLMVDFTASNIKLKRRAIHLTMLATDCDEASARSTLAQCDHHVKTAIVALLNHCNVADAKLRLSEVDGNVRQAINKVAASSKIFS
jgi:N-acetylmuramic acid 6-phosphate etherase